MLLMGSIVLPLIVAPFKMWFPSSSLKHALPFERAQWLSGIVLDSRPRAAGLSLTGVTVLWSLSKTHLS